MLKTHNGMILKIKITRNFIKRMMTLAKYGDKALGSKIGVIAQELEAAGINV